MSNGGTAPDSPPGGELPASSTAPQAVEPATPPQRVEHFRSATLYLGDCRQILPTLPRPDAIVSDPPYGQKLKLNTFRKGRSTTGLVRQPSGRKLALTSTLWPEKMPGDDKPFDPEPVLAAADVVLLWGAHKFGHRLPIGRWLAWDKVPTGKVRDQGDGELAWTNVQPDGAVRILRLLWDGVCVGKGARHEVTRGQKRVHPTQKPELVMAWSLEQLGLAPGAVVCDPYMGAGSTGLAAIRAGHRFVGIELLPQFFDTACRRIEAAERDGNLFIGAVA